jgi:hypothetical protein
MSVCNSVVGIATCYKLEGQGIEIWWGRVISQQSRHFLGPSPPLYNGYRVCFPEVKRLGCAVNHPHYLVL